MEKIDEEPSNLSKKIFTKFIGNSLFATENWKVQQRVQKRPKGMVHEKIIRARQVWRA